LNKAAAIFLIASLFSQAEKTDNVLQQIQSHARQINQKTNPELDRLYSQAKTLERSGLYDEALQLYKQINRAKPGVSKYYNPLKNYLKQAEAWDSLLVFTEAFRQARNNDIQSKIEFLDVHLWMDNNDKWQRLAESLILNSPVNPSQLKGIFQRLINAGKFQPAQNLLNQYRVKSKAPSFYALEMGTYYGMRMAYEKSTEQYLLHLKHNPAQLNLISDRIMIFPNDQKINLQISTLLEADGSLPAGLILGDLQFKMKQYDQAYTTLKHYDAPNDRLLDFGIDLASVGEFVKAEKVLTDIISNNTDEKLLTQAIFEIAKIFENKMVVKSTDLPLSGFYPHNPFFSSPYLPIKDESGFALQKAMGIYDSLRVTKKNAQAAYRLAEVQFRVLGDLDGARYLYEEAYHHGNSRSLKKDAGLGMINISIAKGDLDAAMEKAEEFMKKYPTEWDYHIKKGQILFYWGEFEAADVKLREIVKELNFQEKVVNDLLEVLAVLIGFRHNQDEFVEYAKVQLLIQQNKRTEAMEKLESLFTTNEIYLADMCRYQYAWLSFLQGEIELTKNSLSKIKNETIWIELAHIFHAEILDFKENNLSDTIDSYLEFLELYPESIYYDDVRLRLREITS